MTVKTMRPEPLEYELKGMKFKVALKWEAGKPAPFEGVVYGLGIRGFDIFECVVFNGCWSTTQEAETAGLREAMKWVNENPNG